MLTQDLYVFDSNNVELIPNSTAESLTVFAGRNRIKPSLYFGQPILEVCEQYKLTTDEERFRWFDLFQKAYAFYWSEPAGRMSYFEPAGSERRSTTINEIINSIVFPINSFAPSNNLFNIRLRIPAVELYRIATALPLIDSAMEFTTTLPLNFDIHFIQFHAEDLPLHSYELLDILRRVKNGYVWLSYSEAQYIDARIDPVQFAYTPTKNNLGLISNRANISDWEKLSHSIDSAHLARLSGFIDVLGRKPSNFALRVAGEIRAIYAERFDSIFNILPVETPFCHSLSGIYFNIPNNLLIPVLREAYKARLLPSFINEYQSMPWERGSDIFDALFECYLKGNISTLNDWNTRALSKGGICV